MVGWLTTWFVGGVAALVMGRTRQRSITAVGVVVNVEVNVEGGAGQLMVTIGG